MKWWDDLIMWADGSMTRSALVAGLILLVVSTVVGLVLKMFPRLRQPLFGWIARVARRVPLRVTTPKRQAAALAAEYERGAGEARHTAFEEGLAVAGRNVTERMTREREAALEAQETRHEAEIAQSFQAGKAAKQSELDAARAVVQQPQWRPEVVLDDNAKEYWITVHRAEGTGPATEVTIDADPRYFRFTFAPMFSGSSFANYRGIPTAAGLAEGVDFELTWTDSVGDRQTRPLHVAASEFLPRDRSQDLVTRALLDEAVLAAREEGRQAGLAKVGVAPPCRPLVGSFITPGTSSGPTSFGILSRKASLSACDWRAKEPSGSKMGHRSLTCQARAAPSSAAWSRRRDARWGQLFKSLGMTRLACAASMWWNPHKIRTKYPSNPRVG